jgi:hypothetical protein
LTTAAGAGAGAPAGSSQSGSSSGGSGNLNLGLGGGTGVTGTGLGNACVADVSTAQAVPLDIYIMLDTSGSMTDMTAANVSKWDAVKLAVETFLKDKASAGLGVGLQYFPLIKPNVPASCTSNAGCGDSGPCFLKACFNFPSIIACDVNTDCVNPADGMDYGPCQALGQCSKGADYVCRGQATPCGQDDTGKDLGNCAALTSSVCLSPESCDITQYATPAMTIAALPGAVTGLLASIDAQLPSGRTPTAPALSGAIAEASAWAKAHPDHRVVTVLATDGLPTECAPLDIGQVAALAKTGVAATPSISTFVIGVFGPDDVLQGAPDNLNQIAVQGGTKSAFIVDTQKDVTMQFLNALDAIRGSRLACQFLIPAPANAQTIDYYGHVNVQFTTGGKESGVLFVKNEAGCDATSGGWYYDVDPAAGDPKRIIACPASCTQFEAAPEGSSVGIALGCTTNVK